MNANYNYRADSDIPLELTGSTPRKVRFIGGGVTGARVATIILALTTIFGVWTCIDALNQIRNRTILQRYGQEVVGEITGIGHASRVSVRTVSYTFIVEGRKFSGLAQRPQSLDGSFQVLDPIIIRYLPGNPDINHPTAWEWTVFMNTIPIVSMSFFAIIGILAMMLLYRERKLASKGMPVAGVVSNCGHKNNTFWIDYDFSMEDGGSIKGGGYYSTPLSVGASIWILYLPQNPRRNAPYPLPDVSVEQ